MTSDVEECDDQRRWMEFKAFGKLWNWRRQEPLCGKCEKKPTGFLGLIWKSGKNLALDRHSDMMVIDGIPRWHNFYPNQGILVNVNIQGSLRDLYSHRRMSMMKLQNTNTQSLNNRLIVISIYLQNTNTTDSQYIDSKQKSVQLTSVLEQQGVSKTSNSTSTHASTQPQLRQLEAST